MLFNFTRYIRESSTLSGIGVPKVVLKYIQETYKISNNSAWVEVRYKKNIEVELKKKEIAVFVMIADDRVKLFINSVNKYFSQVFKYSDDDFGSHVIGDRVETSITAILKGITSGSVVYKCNVDSIRLHGDDHERMMVQEERLEDVTDDFRVRVISNFNDIIRRLYGLKYDEVMSRIADNIASEDNTTNKEDILKIISDRSALKSMAREYENAKKSGDLLGLQNLDKKYNSLTKFNEFLINFEVLYSDKLDEFLTIKDLIDRYGDMKVTTAFMYYLYSGKVMEL